MKMGRTYHRKPDARRYASVTQVKLEKAIFELNSGRSQRYVCAKFNIPRGTLQNKLAKRHGKIPGHQTALSDVEEKAMVQHLTTLADWGFPMDKSDLRIFVKGYLDKEGRQVRQFKNNCPGEEWASSFVRRHRQSLTNRLCQNISCKRAEVNRATITKYFDNLQESLNGVPPENIINYDETNLTDDAGRKHSIFRRGVKYPDRVMNSAKTSTSLMFAASAAGELLPVYVVYKSEHIWDTWTDGGPDGTRYNRSKSGWFDNVCFRDWFYTIALPFLRRKEGRKVLIGDNLSSHFSQDVIDECQQCDIHFLCLPPNSTHLCQPLDVSFFRPLKIQWRNILNEWKSGGGRRSATVSKDKFPQLLKQLLVAIGAKEGDNIRSGFRKTGIYPFSPSEVLKTLPTDSGDESTAASNTNASVSEAFVGMLKTMRHGSGEGCKPMRRKKITVEPGCSVGSTSASSCQSAVVPVSSAEANNSTGRTSDNSEDDNSSSDGDESATSESSVKCSDLDDNGEGDPRPGVSPEAEAAEEHGTSSDDEPLSKLARNTLSADTGSVNEDDYVIVRYTLQHSCCYYVGLVSKVLADKRYEVKFMRRSKTQKSLSFSFPNVEDFDVIEHNRIIQQLSPNVDRRGRYVFNVSTIRVPTQHIM